MKSTSFAIVSAYTGLLAFIIACIDSLLKGSMPIGQENGLTYLAFVAWAVYFFSGCDWKGGVKAMIGYAVGIGFSIGIFEIAGALGSAGMTFFAVPTAVFIVVFLVLYLEKVPWVNLIPAMFVASGCFFGIMGYIPGATYKSAATAELVYGGIGLLFGWFTIEGKKIILKALEKK